MSSVLKRRVSPIVAVAVACVTIVAYADDESPSPDRTATAPPGVIHASVEGSNFCLGCALKKRKGAAAQCSVFGHRHSLRVVRATTKDGKELADLKGWVLHYLENEKSQALINEHHGENVKLSGIIYPLERVFEVSSMMQTEE